MSLRPLLLTIAGMSLLLAAGCRSVVGGACHKPQAYAAAENLSPLKVPAGVQSPATEDAMKIPALTEPEVPLDPDGPCLDAPPAITAPPLPPSGIEEPRPRRPGERRAAPDASATQSGDTEDSGRERTRRRPTPPR